MAMTEEEVGEPYTRLAFQYESSIEALLAKGLIDTDLAVATKKEFYDSFLRDPGCQLIDLCLTSGAL